MNSNFFKNKKNPIKFKLKKKKKIPNALKNFFPPSPLASPSPDLL